MVHVCFTKPRRHLSAFRDIRGAYFPQCLTTDIRTGLPPTHIYILRGGWWGLGCLMSHNWKEMMQHSPTSPNGISANKIMMVDVSRHGPVSKFQKMVTCPIYWLLHKELQCCICQERLLWLSCHCQDAKMLFVECVRVTESVGNLTGGYS